jgi:hypothetical protein
MKKVLALSLFFLLRSLMNGRDLKLCQMKLTFLFCLDRGMSMLM